MNNLDELDCGGSIYWLGVMLLRIDGFTPCAHAMWHLLVTTQQQCTTYPLEIPLPTSHRLYAPSMSSLYVQTSIISILGLCRGVRANNYTEKNPTELIFPISFVCNYYQNVKTMFWNFFLLYSKQGRELVIHSIPLSWRTLNRFGQLMFTNQNAAF